MTYPTQELLKEILNYNPETGIFTWKKVLSSLSRIKVGQEAGTITEEGYVAIGIGRRQYPAHRLAWLYMTGKLPKHQIDHRDKNRTHNWWANLREATHSQNQMNKRSTRKTLGLKGTTYSSRHKKWHAQIRINKKTIYLGYYDTTEEAHLAYAFAANVMFGDFASME